MAIGLQVFDSTGVSIINTSSQVSSVLGNISIPAEGTYYITDVRFSLGTPFIIASEFYDGALITESFAGTKYTITITRLQFGNFEPFSIIYGVY